MLADLAKGGKSIFIFLTICKTINVPQIIQMINGGPFPSCANICSIFNALMCIYVAL